MMEISLLKGRLEEQKADMLVVNMFEGAKGFGGAAKAVDEAFDGLIVKIAKEESFSGERGSALLVRPHEGSVRRILLVGLGKQDAFNEEAVRVAAAVTVEKARALKLKRVVSVLHGAGNGGLSPKRAMQALVEGARLAEYGFDKYKSKKNGTIDSLVVVVRQARTVQQAEAGQELGERFAQAAIYARDLVNEPAAHMHPADLVARAQEIAKASRGKIRVRVFDRVALEKMGAGGVLAVAQGSDAEPYLVHMTYRGAPGKKSVAIVGKAITFDSGGLSLKPADSMMTMKCDMAGAAAVLGAFSQIAALKPKTVVHGIFAAAENMPSGKAIRPGDVARAMNGKTIEILNTDAEGRVTLADSLTYAVRQKPDAIVDLATLTGACMVALGEEVSGLMSNAPKLAQDLLMAAARAGEKFWELPLEKNYKPLLKSEVADLKNIAGKYGGALTAGLFLEEFVGETPWAHLDIAGPSFAERPMNAYTKHGGTGFGARTLLEWLRSM